MKAAQHQIEQINLRLTPGDLADFDALASELALNRSNMLRYLVREMTRAIRLGLEIASVEMIDDAQTKTEQINLRLTRADLDESDALASKLALNRSNMLRYLVREKKREIAAAFAAVRAVASKRRGARV